MPPRLITLGIIALWLTAVGWTAYREGWREPEPPPLLDRTDEVGKQSARWRAWRGEENLGPIQTSLARSRNDGLFVLRADFNPGFAFRVHGFAVKALHCRCRVTARGQFRSQSCLVKLRLRWFKRELQFTGRRDGAHCTFGLTRSATGPAREWCAEGGDGAFNLLHPLHRMPDLHEGRTWQALAFDPIEVALNADAEPFHRLQASVTPDNLLLPDKTVACWRVDYRDGAKVRARIWTQADDGLVLRQEVHWGDESMRLERESEQGLVRELPRLLPRR